MAKNEIFHAIEPHINVKCQFLVSPVFACVSIGWQYCCAALCLVAQDVRNCVLIINEGAIPHMLAGAKDGDMVTKQSCCAVLSTLSSKVKPSNLFYSTMRQCSLGIAECQCCDCYQLRGGRV